VFCGMTSGRAPHLVACDDGAPLAGMALSGRTYRRFVSSMAMHQHAGRHTWDPLIAPTATVYAVAQGQITIGASGLGAAGKCGQRRADHGPRIVAAPFVEREIP